MWFGSGSMDARYSRLSCSGRRRLTLATCRAVAANAGAAIHQPQSAPRINITNNNTAVANVNAVGDNSSLINNMNEQIAAGPPKMDFSGLDDVGANIGAAVRRKRVEQANMEGCMAQRGYLAARR